jgi:hypothetical protein
MYGHLFSGTDEETAARLDERLRAAQTRRLFPMAALDGDLGAVVGTFYP